MLKLYFNIIQYLMLATLSFASGIILANSEAETLFKTGLGYYQQKQYTLAIPPLENAVKLNPKSAKHHHILAVSYGRKAENSNWFSAISLAKKALTHLEIAINLDRENLEILDDLMDFYREAPGFLGGNKEKADEIENLIKKLRHAQNKSIMTAIENDHINGNTVK